jgi:type IV secretion system protein VirD4
MVSRQETARALLTPGEVMQLPPDDELVLVSGRDPIRAKKSRYYENPQLRGRIQPPPKPSPTTGILGRADHSQMAGIHDWMDAIA